MSHPSLATLLLEAIRYEHWLRFYFLDLPDDGQALTATLRVPPEVVEVSRQAEPHLIPLLESLQDKEISLDGARDAVFAHVARCIQADAQDPTFHESLFQLIADPDFRRGLDAFHGWVQELANGETHIQPFSGQDAVEDEESPRSFAQWEAAFEAWAAGQPVQHVTTISPFSSQSSC